MTTIRTPSSHATPWTTDHRTALGVENLHGASSSRMNGTGRKGCKRRKESARKRFEGRIPLIQGREGAPDILIPRSTDLCEWSVGLDSHGRWLPGRRRFLPLLEESTRSASSLTWTPCRDGIRERDANGSLFKSGRKNPLDTGDRTPVSSAARHPRGDGKDSGIANTEDR